MFLAAKRCNRAYRKIRAEIWHNFCEDRSIDLTLLEFFNRARGTCVFDVSIFLEREYFTSGTVAKVK